MSKTRLFEAVKNLDLQETKAILKAKPELLSVWNDQGRNLLHVACSADCKKLKKPEAAAVKMVGFLLERGLDIEQEGGAATHRHREGIRSGAPEMAGHARGFSGHSRSRRHHGAAKGVTET